jgi:hypothetical protein
MKRTFTLLTAFLFPFMLSAQDLILDTTVTVTPEYSKFSFAINGGMTFSFMDVNESKSSPVFGIGLQYTPVPCLGVNIDAQYGTLKAGDRSKPALYNMEFRNNYLYGSLNIRFYPLRLVKDAAEKTSLRYLGGIYGGIGLAAISSKAEAFNSAAPEAGYISDPDGVQLALPLEVGYSLPLAQLSAGYSKNNYGRSLLSLNINYRHNLGFSEKMDGYNPPGSNNKGKDAFSTLSLGLIYNF